MPIITFQEGAIVTTPAVGRGAWPAKGTGGTLSTDGTKAGGFYRAPVGTTMLMPGKLAWTKLRMGQPVNVNEYAVHMGVRAIQGRCGLVADGVFGPNTAAAVKDFQQRASLTIDGVVGPTTARRMWNPHVQSVANAAKSGFARLGYLTAGHMKHESLFDPGAVGVSTPEDLGLAQINGPQHPALSIADRLTPQPSIEFAVTFVAMNLAAFPTNERDAIAAYNLGITGARAWVKAGRPRFWGSTDVPKYIDAVLKAAATV